MSEHGWFPREGPRKAKGGIRARTTRGSFGEQWWSRRWTESLEAVTPEGRLARGRAYARKGQVVSLDVERGRVRARVQGSRPTPYAVDIRLTPIDEAGWGRAIEALSRSALFVAKLLAGELPAELEPLFDTLGLSLLPKSSKELATECTCPDWSRPCKHVAAVYSLVGEELDRDPFLILLLRGLSRDELVTKLGAATPVRGDVAPPGQPLDPEPAVFFGNPSSPDPSPGEAREPPVPAALLEALGAVPLWRGGEPVGPALAPFYRAASIRALERLAGD